MGKRKEIVTINNVIIVPGQSLKSKWHISMQKIETDKGSYIAIKPSEGGYDWSQEIGKTIPVIIKDNSGYDWILRCQNNEVSESPRPISIKQEIIDNEVLPRGYDINQNPELKEAYDYIKNGSPLIFLTGGAGTGKSTFIKFLKKYLKTDLNKNCVILAYNGIAAINVGGQTIHSFFRFKFDPFENEEIKITNKNQIVDYVDLIIIDEISMVPAWMLDHIDYALRLWCKNDKPFGGKQMLLIGDCFQLPPVIDQNDKDAMKFFNKWENPSFLAANVLKENNLKNVQLKIIYRQQNDQDFIRRLNRIRSMEDGYEEDIGFINGECFHGEKVQFPQNYLLLTTKNERADKYNDEKITSLISEGKKFTTFYAIKTPSWDENYYTPSPEELKICVNAKIMVTKNNSSNGLVNGDRGIVADFGKDYVIVEIYKDDQLQQYTLQRETWQKFKYVWDDESKTIQQEVVASFSQIPLRLGWAVTIHKSQGLTLDYAAIDADDAWDSGQVYVALSRVRRLKGIFLVKKIPPSAVKVDPYVKAKYIEFFPDQFEEELIIDNKSIKKSEEIMTNGDKEEESKMALGDYCAENEDKIAKNHEEAEWEESKKENNENFEKKDDICLPDLEKSLDNFKLLIEDYMRLKERIKHIEEEKRILEKNVIDKEEDLSNLQNKINGLEDVHESLSKEIERLNNEKENLEKQLKDKDSNNDESIGNAKTAQEPNPPKVPEKIHVEIYRVRFDSRGWYDIVPYEGKLKDITQKKMKQTSAQIKQGAFKKKKINVSVDKDKGIIYMPKNMFNDNEKVLRAEDTTIEVTESV